MGKFESNRARKSSRWDVRDRVSSILAVAALALVVALVAIPIAVDDSADPRERAAPVEPSPEPACPTIVLPQAIDAVSAVLAPALSDPKPDANAMALRIGSLGPDAIPVVVGMLCGNIPMPEFAHGTLDQPIHPAALECRERVLFASLRRFNSKDVVTFLRRNASFATLDEQFVFARLLGEVGNQDAAEALLEVFAGFEPMQLQRDYVRSTLEEALVRCLERDPAVLASLAKSVQKIDPTLLPMIARAVGRTRGLASAQFLARMLEKSAELDALVLGELARVSESSGIALPDASIATVRRLLDNRDAGVVRAAITVLGRLCDRDSFDLLTRRLDDSDRLVAAAAHWSLRSMARVDQGLAPPAWTAWREEQDEWWEGRAQELILKLHSSDAAQVFVALNELNLHPYFKHDVARAIGPLASDARPALAIAAINVLQRIGSTQACASLIQALTIDDERRAPLCKALHTLTGLDLPPDYVQWSNALSDSP